jgi:hypothetical protein
MYHRSFFKTSFAATTTAEKKSKPHDILEMSDEQASGTGTSPRKSRRTAGLSAANNAEQYDLIVDDSAQNGVRYR